MKYPPHPNSLYTQNRSRFVSAMRPNSIAIFQANPVLSENGDAVYAYKASSDVMWLSGITQEKTMVVLYPDNADEAGREVLVIQRPNEHLEKWNGHLLRKDEATAISGIKEVRYVDSIDAALQVWIHHAETIYLSTNENDRLGSDIPRTDLAFVKSIMERYPLHQYQRSAAVMKRLRAVKTEDEVAVTREAVSITHKALDRVLRYVEPGVMEYEIEAEIMHEFLRNRATRNAYGSIIASGDSARVLHYVENNRECKDGDLLLMDFGAEYGGYTADLTRTIPVNGRFTERQAEVYNACLAVLEYCASILKPGIRYADYIKLANEEMERQLLKIKLITEAEIAAQDPDNPAFKRYFYHGIGHHLGIDVHDLGTRHDAVEKGMLFTIEPGIYIEEEQMGIRIENNYWLTEDGNINLFEGMPISVAEIEAAMARG
jgi:Xaa-Pro aminopeptidase